MSFAWPWLLLLIPVFWFLPTRRKRDEHHALEHSFLMHLSDQEETQQRRSTMINWVNFLLWTCLIVAIARPQILGEPVNDERNGRSLYLSVDLSESMLERDMTWNNRAIERYQAVQAVVGEFVDKRRQDFIGLVVFGAFAEIQSPLTNDTSAIKELLFDLRPGMAEGSTAIGDGLALAVKQLRESEAKDKVIILLSDGENNAGQVTPEQATTVAQQSGIKVYTIGFGGQGRSGLFSGFGLSGTGIDEATLKDIAEKTEGQYFRASSTNDLVGVFELIDQLEPIEEFGPPNRVLNERYYWPLLLAVAILLIAQLTAFVHTLKVRS